MTKNQLIRWLHWLVTSLLVLGLLGFAPPASSSAMVRIHPVLAAIATSAPAQKVVVIVQKLIGATGVEAQVALLGGKVTKALPIINAFAAEMTAGAAAKLASFAGVRWVSLDTPMKSTSTCEQTAIWTAIADTELDEEEPNVADGAVSTIGTLLSSAGVRAYGLVQFDLSTIPADAIVQNATFGIYVQTARSLAHVDPVHIMTTDWSEAATWNKRDSTSPWATGAFSSTDHAATAIGTIIPSTTGFKTLDVTGAVANWVNGSSANHGFLIRSTGTDTDEAVYTAREAASNKPYLMVTFTGPCATPRNGFVSWANALSSRVANSFTNPDNLFDSALGPNGTYGYGSNKKIALAGFTAEATPGSAIGKVEAVFYGYAPVKLGAADDPKITVWVGGTSGKSVVLNHHAFDTLVGAANAGMVYLDITSSRTWQWADFDNNLELVIDQSKNGAGDTIYYDAVGLRVTLVPGTDGNGDTGGDTSALAAVDASKQLNFYNQITRSSELWNTAAKLQGKGVTVAVVDSGVYKTKDLTKRVRLNANFNEEFHDAADRYGHGTFVAGIIAGSGSHSGNKYMGVAPRADVLNVRVSNDYGMSAESDVVAALQWVLENKGKYNIRVVNLSLNAGLAQSYATSPLCAAVEVLWFNGIVVVASAGNNGTATLFPPANDPFVITVGATDDKGTLSIADDVIASFSAYGTTESGFVKPDLVTPGRNIVGLLPENDKLSMSAARIKNRIDKTYFKMSGTSMSAPMVSGAVALLLQDEPNLTPDQVKYRLLATANKNWPGYNPTTAGAGYLDSYAAVNGTTTQSANTGIAASQLLGTGTNLLTWGSVSWNSVSWNSVSWNSVSWNSVSWNSVSWNSDYWDDGVGASSVDGNDAIPELTNSIGTTSIAEASTEEVSSVQANKLFLPLVTR